MEKHEHLLPGGYPQSNSSKLEPDVSRSSLKPAWKHRIWTLLFTLSLAGFLVNATNALKLRDPLPIEERVEKILSETPLIGELSRLCAVSTDY